jgi:U5 small nuclear ribonucleoprotein component
MDRLIVELKLPPADAYLKIKHTLEEINSIISNAAAHIPERESLKVSPLLGNVAFSSTLYGFVFTLDSFVQMYIHTFPGINP